MVRERVVAAYQYMVNYMLGNTRNTRISCVDEGTPLPAHWWRGTYTCLSRSERSRERMTVQRLCVRVSELPRNPIVNHMPFQ